MTKQIENERKFVVQVGDLSKLALSANLTKGYQITQYYFPVNILSRLYYALGYDSDCIKVDEYRIARLRYLKIKERNVACVLTFKQDMHEVEVNVPFVVADDWITEYSESLLGEVTKTRWYLSEHLGCDVVLDHIADMPSMMLEIESSDLGEVPLPPFDQYGLTVLAEWTGKVTNAQLATLTHGQLLQLFNEPNRVQL